MGAPMSFLRAKPETVNGFKPTTFGLMRHAVRQFPKVSYVDLKDVKHLRRQWLAKVLHLGPRWKAIQYITRSQA